MRDMKGLNHSGSKKNLGEISITAKHLRGEFLKETRGERGLEEQVNRKAPELSGKVTLIQIQPQRF